MMERTTDEISNELDILEKEINDTRESLDVLQQQKADLDLQILTIGESIRKAKHSITTKRSRKESLTREYWRAKGR